MIVKRDFLTILSNLSNRRPVDLDSTVFAARNKSKRGAAGILAFPPCAALWEFKNSGNSCIGVRIRAPLENPEFLAARLAAIALERQINPIFLSYINRSEMQQFGFRVEQLSGLPKGAQQQFEAQLVRFWQLALVIDSSEISSLR